MACLLGAGGAPQRTATNPALGNTLAAVSALTFALTMMGYRWLSVRAGGSGGAGGGGGGSGDRVGVLVWLPVRGALGGVSLCGFGGGGGVGVGLPRGGCAGVGGAGGRRCA